MELTNSKRLMYSASYVTTQFTPDEQRELESKPGAGMAKANLMRSLGLTARDLEHFQLEAPAQSSRHASEDQQKLLVVARQLAASQRPTSTMELASALAPISFEAITAFAGLASKIKDTTMQSKVLFELSDRRRKISPIGRIHLERIEMYPAGVQRGELVFTVPMAPGEEVAISHKEWSTSSREFEDIVQDFFESYSERGVAEKSDASMSRENESKHASAINFGASLSGSYAGVTLTTTLGITSTNEERNSVKESAQKSREVTEKASARTRKEHKVSVKLETKTGNEDRSAKTITNTGATAIRIDYYRMMRKWRTDLFRYGLRQTYDIAIPVPGVRLWAQYQKLEELDRRLRMPIQFGLAVSAINPGNFRIEAARVRAGVPDEPPFQIVEDRLSRTDFLDEGAADQTRFGDVSFDVPPGYFLADAALTASCAIWIGHPVAFDLINISDSPSPFPGSGQVFSLLPELIHRSGHLTVAFAYRNISQASVQLHLTYHRETAVFEGWQRAVWDAIRTAAEARHREELVLLQDERDLLYRVLTGKDTLTLRRLEREELMRLVMYWLLGPGSFLKPGGVDVPLPPPPGIEPVQLTADKMLQNEKNFQATGSTSFFPTLLGISELAAYDAILFGEFVKFMHQAVEWENLLYFLYPYFWGSEPIGHDKLLFEHGDPEHERFLRAGYARIVLPVRPGFEEDFTALVEHGTLSGHLSSPYMPIAQEIANFARTNYSGIPPANPELQARPLLFPEQRATWDTMQRAMADVEAFKAAHSKYPDKLSDLPAGEPVDFWGNRFVYKMPGLGADFDLISLGADNKAGGEGLDADISSAAGASLVATWFDYTPTSGIDIEIDTKSEHIT